MPVYEYRCPRCHYITEAYTKITDTPPETVACQAEACHKYQVSNPIAQRILSTPAIGRVQGAGLSPSRPTPPEAPQPRAQWKGDILKGLAK